MHAGGRRYIVYSDPEMSVRIWNLADLHLGNAGVVERKLDSDIQTIRDDRRSYWFGGGDYADFIGIGDKRFDPTVLAEWIDAKDLGALGLVLSRRVCDRLEPIGPKCLGVLDGNHEHAYGLHMQQQGITQRLADELGVHYLRYSAFVDLVFVYSPRARNCPKLVSESACPRGKKRLSVRMFLHHGAGYAQTPGGKLNKVVGAMDFFDADVIFLAHIHDQIVKSQVRLHADHWCRKILERGQIGVITGSYLSTYAEGQTGYGEMKLWRPVPLGAVYVDITPYRREVAATVKGVLSAGSESETTEPDQQAS